MAACRDCAHTEDAHEHLRSGSDCALCDCTRFRATRFSLRLRAPGPSADDELETIPEDSVPAA